MRNAIEKEILKQASKIRGAHLPISQKNKGKVHVLKIQSIYRLINEKNEGFLFKAKNYKKKPKFLYFLAIKLASQSSDLLASIAKPYAKKNQYKLIQYAIQPKSLRVPLLALQEIESAEDCPQMIEDLNNFKKDFRNKLDHLQKFLENK